LRNLARVSYHEAAALDFAGIRIQRHYKVDEGFIFMLVSFQKSQLVENKRVKFQKIKKGTRKAI